MVNLSSRTTFSSLTSMLVCYALVLLLVPSTLVFGAPGSVILKPKAAALNQQAVARREGELLIRFRAGTSEQKKATVLASHGTRRKQQLRGESTVEKLEVLGGQNVETAALQLSLNPDVEFAEPNFLIGKDDLSTSDPKFDEQWALRNTGQGGGQFGSDINVITAWRTTTGSPSTVIAVIDSGIDFTHPDLAGNRWENPSPGSIGDVNGWDYVADSGVVTDEQGHGTAIAGIIAAEGNNAIGITGVMWHASLMSLRVLDVTGTGDVGSAVEAIDYAVSHGAQVINLSWGTTGNSLALKDAIERAIRRGVVVVCSAGNNGRDVDASSYYPASFGSRDLIAVAATDNYDQLTSWSDYGRRNITVGAPGNNILTTQLGGNYASVSGTSASAPLVSGVAGLLKSVSPALGPHNVVKAITENVRQVVGLSGKVSSGGVVDASAALKAVRGNQGNGNGNGNNGNNGNGQGPGNGQSNVPPALRPDNSERRANGKDGLHVPPPPGLSGAPQANLPNLEQSRKIRTSPITTAPPATIRANLVCADCDPSGGGGAGGSDPYFGTARTRPENDTGDPGVTLGSRNFNWSLPIVELAGRSGLDLSLTLYYNSLVWTKQGSSIQYNADHGSPAPGFQLGLPRLQALYFDTDDNAYAYTMITPSGGRVEMKQVSTGVYESSDGTYTQLTFSGSTPIVKTTDGSQFVFGVAVSGEWRCTQIKDRNGNYLSATYNTDNGHLLTITDTLGRVVTLTYDGDGNLDTITQPWGGGSHVWASFHYDPALTMSFSFPGLSVYGATNNSPKTVLRYVAFADNTSYHLDYNSYGQVYQIRHKAPDGHELAHTYYTINTTGSQSDCPRFTDKREYAQDWNNNQEAITSYSITNNATWTKPETSAQQTGTLVQVTAPDSTIYKQYSHATGWDAGLTQLTEEWSASARKKYVSTTWTQDNTGLSYPQNPRVAEVSIYDDAGNRRRTTIEYVTGYNLPTHIREYANDGQTLLRLTAIGYKWDSVYFDKRIIGLPYERVVYDGPSGNPVSRLIYHYDWSDNYFPAQVPSTNFTNLGYYEGRGNLVGIQRYDCSTPSSAYDGNQAVWQKLFRYNMAGSTVWIEDGSWHRTYIAYGDSFSDNNNSRNTLAYPTQVTDHDGHYSTTQYNFDFGAVTRTHVPTSGTGGNTTYVDEVRTYDAYGRLDRATNQTNSAYLRFVYDSNGNYVHTYQTLLDVNSNEFHSWQVMDGAGRVRAAAAEHPGSTGGFTGQLTTFNNMGRAVEQTNPTEIDQYWVPAGDDVYVSSTQGGWRSTQQAYDWKGRPTLTTNTDGTQRSITYGGCGCAGGEVSTAQDEHGRQRRFTKDTLGRLATVEELNWSGSVYATTSYSYNARDQITQINQSGLYRTFAYDGHARLQTRTTPEQGTTGFSYNADDTTNVMTDARGATTTYGYNAEHLVTSITYGSPSPVAATANVSFVYDAAGHRTSMTDGLGSATYNYNNLAQLTSETRAFSGVGSYTLSYSYNLAGELASITNPWNAQVSYAYDKAGRLTTVNGSGYYGVSNYANSMAYRAFGAIKSMTYGNIQNAHTLTTAYDRRLRPTKWDVSNVLGYNYNYDYFNEHTGRVTYAGSIYDPTLDRSYEYDNVGRLAISHSGAEARAHAYSGQWGTQDGPYSHGYDYDVWGNLTHRYGWGGDGQSSGDIYRSYTNNRMNGFNYDAAGNFRAADGSVTYDATGQQISFPGGGMTHSYDGDGLRAKKTENGATTYYLRSSVLGGQVVAEINWFSVTWGWNRGYVYAGSQLLAVQQGGVYWMHEDPVTKSKRVTNSSGTIVSAIELDPWGASTSRNVNSAFEPRKFTSYTNDADGGDDAMMRRYGSYWSRFSQPDPYDGSYDLRNPQSFNRYAYTQNDPVNFVDPSGLNAEAPGQGCGEWMTDPNGERYWVKCVNGSVTVTGGGSNPFTLSGSAAILALWDPFGPGFGPNRGAGDGGEDGAIIVANAVEAALQVLAQGCYDDKWNQDVKPGDSSFAQVANADKYTKDWKSAFSLHSDAAKESPVVATVKIFSDSTLLAQSLMPLGTPSTLSYVVKYYPGQGMAVTAPTNSSAHVSGAAGYLVGEPVNVGFAKQVMEVLPKCKT